MFNQIVAYLQNDSKASLKLGALGLVFGFVSFVITSVYPNGYLISGLLNVLMFSAWGSVGVAWIVRQEILHPLPLKGTPAKLLGIVTATICFVLALVMLLITLLYFSGGSL